MVNLNEDKQSMKLLTKTLLYLVSFPVFSRIYGSLTKLRYPKFIIRKIIRWFIETYKINMDEYKVDVDDYNSLAEIFIRKLDPAKRALIPNPGSILSPADGIVSSMELIRTDKAVQVKGVEYSISECLNREIEFSNGWYITTIYLSPSDYHRFHFPVSGSLNGYCHIRGRLFPVNKLGLNNIKKLFLRNERILIDMNFNGKQIFIAAVGATFVGSIKMEFIDNYKRDNKWKPKTMDIAQLQEMGRFELGSTIIMATPEKMATPVDNLIGKEIKTGDILFKLI